MIFFWYTLGKIDPLTIVAGVGAYMVGLCRKALETPRAGAGGAAGSTANAGLRDGLMSHRSVIRQMALMSIRKGDYDTCKACFDAYGDVFGEYVKTVYGRSWESDEFMRALLDDMDLYWDRGLKDDRQVLSDLIRTYGRMGAASAKYYALNMIVAGSRNGMLDNIAGSLEKLGIELAARGNLLLAEDLVRRMKDVASSEHTPADTVLGILGSVGRISRSAVLKDTDIKIPLMAIVSSLGIVESMIHRHPDSDHVKRGIVGLHEAAAGLGSSVGGRAIHYDRAREVLCEVSGCVAEAMWPSTAKLAGQPLAHPGYKQAIISALVDLACRLAVPPSQNGNRPVSSAVMRWLILATWMLATAQSGPGGGSYREEIDHILHRADGTLDGLAEALYDDVEDASVLALYCSLYLQGAAAVRGAGLVCRAAKMSGQRGSFDLALAALDLAGSRAAAGGDASTSKEIALYWRDLAKEYGRKFKADPRYDALLVAKSLFPKYARVRRQFLPARRLHVSMGADGALSEMFSGAGLEEFARVRNGPGRRARRRIRPARRRAGAAPAVLPAAPPQGAPNPAPARRPRPAGRRRAPAKRSPGRRGSRARRPPAAPRRPSRRPPRPARRRLRSARKS